jgi:hypothetical protein
VLVRVAASCREHTPRQAVYFDAYRGELEDNVLALRSPAVSELRDAVFQSPNLIRRYDDVAGGSRQSRHNRPG